MEGVGDADGAIGLLAVFQHRDQAATDGEAGAVERVQEFGLAAALWFEAGVHAARLKITADRDGRDFAVGVLPR